MYSEIIIVTGLPRLGTSLMMQTLDPGGVDVVTDAIREAEVDNPLGYYEFERVERIKEDASWMPEARGKAVKIVCQLLYDLLRSERYLIIFMVRDLNEVLHSQETMLARLNRPSIPREQIEPAFRRHLERLRAWLATQRHIDVLEVCYDELVNRPEQQAAREFLPRRPS